MKFEISQLRNSTVWSLYRMRDRIQIDPDYQRLGDIWTLEKRQLLIDTIINDFDVPKLYLHKFKDPLKKGTRSYDYAIIDGRQRLETMWAFIDGKIALTDDFEYFKDSEIKAGGLTYKQLGQECPDLKVQFDSFSLTTIAIDTDELEMIEEMFSRLNESAPLSAPEKRNAFGGPLPVAIRKLAAESFFTEALPFPNERYRHFDMAVKFLLIEHDDEVVDTKKVYLDKFVRNFADQSRTKTLPFFAAAETNVKRMKHIFTDKDPQLRQVGMVMLYYHLFRLADREGWTQEITRKRLIDFDKAREANRKIAERDLTKANYDLIEFDRYSQSPNDAYAIKLRLRVLLKQAFKKEFATDDL
jgi:hypothetical protein